MDIKNTFSEQPQSASEAPPSESSSPAVQKRWVVSLALLGTLLAVMGWFTFSLWISSSRHPNSGDISIFFVPILGLAFVSGVVVFIMMYRRSRKAYLPLIVAAAFFAFTSVMNPSRYHQVIDFLWPAFMVTLLIILGLYWTIPKRV